jgi:flagellin-like hook-associated protein FlgL
MSGSAITLTSGMRKNLFSLQNTNSLLERTQKRMATGQRVQTAVDDPVNYFTALGHRQRAEDLASRKDEMSESIQLVMSANEGVTAITSLIASAKSLAQSALSAATQKEVETLEGQYNEVLSQINQLVDDSGYKGVNLLGGADVKHEVKFNENGSSLLTMNGFNAKTDSTGLNISEVDGDLATFSKVTTGTENQNQITWEAAKSGTAGDGTTIIINQGGDASTAAEFKIEVSGSTVTITLGRDADGALIPITADELADAVNKDSAASAVVTATAGPGDGTAVAATN